MGLGDTTDISLDMAREEARKARLLLRDGIDPIDHRAAERGAQEAEKARTEAKTVTFKKAAEQYYEFHSKRWSNPKHRQQFHNTLRDYVHPIIGHLIVSEVDQLLVQQILEQPAEDAKGHKGKFWELKPVTASRVRQRVEAVLAFATVRKYREGENPARWSGHLSHVLPPRADISEVKHHRALPFVQVPAFIAELREREGIGARALQFAVLTAARTGEVLGAMWEEFDLDAGLWVVPASRMKAGRSHEVPLSKAALDILRSLPEEKGNNYVFFGSPGRGLSNMTLTAVLRRMGYGDRCTPHGFRSSFRDWAGDQTSFPREVIEAAMAHIVGDAAERAYRRGTALQKRARLMEAWATFCAKPNASSAQVSSIRRAA